MEKKIEILNINPHIYRQPIFDKGAKAIQWRKKMVFSTNDVGTLDIHT
jgi:hypothetical protein